MPPWGDFLFFFFFCSCLAGMRTRRNRLARAKPVSGSTQRRPQVGVYRAQVSQLRPGRPAGSGFVAAGGRCSRRSTGGGPSAGPRWEAVSSGGRAINQSPGGVHRKLREKNLAITPRPLTGTPPSSERRGRGAEPPGLRAALNGLRERSAQCAINPGTPWSLSCCLGDCPAGVGSIAGQESGGGDHPCVRIPGQNPGPNRGGGPCPWDGSFIQDVKPRWYQ